MKSLPAFPNPGARIGILGIAFDANSSFLRGSALAPPGIRAAFFSESSNAWSESGLDLGRPELYADLGDIAPCAEDFVEATDAAASRLQEAGLAVLGLGGDHSVTFPLVRAAARRHGALSILHFDAHPDLYDNYEGNRLSHACPFARIMEEGLASGLVQVGIRTATGHLREQAARFGVRTIPAWDWADALGLELDGPVYVSFDLDCLDPAFAPGVSHHEPGGLSTREALAVLKAFRGRLVGADIVEYNPSRDRDGVTAMTAAKLWKELVARMLED